MTLLTLNSHIAPPADAHAAIRHRLRSAASGQVSVGSLSVMDLLMSEFRQVDVSKTPTIAELIARLESPLSILRTHTTGLDNKTDRIVCVGILPGSIDGAVFSEENPASWRFNPGKPSHPDALRVHGMTEEFLENFPQIDWVHLHDMMAYSHRRTLVVHDAAFEFGFLDAEFARFPCTEALDLPVIDTKVIAEILWPGEKSSIDVMAARLGFDVSEHAKGPRSAVGDCRILARCLPALRAKLLEIV